MFETGWLPAAIAGWYQWTKPKNEDAV